MKYNLILENGRRYDNITLSEAIAIINKPTKSHVNYVLNIVEEIKIEI